MITRVKVKNFKRFKNVDIELGSTVVLIGPNNSGKSSALQAIALWAEGLKKWNEKRAGKASPEKRPGVTLNRKDLVSIPVPSALMLWRDLHVRDVAVSDSSKTITKNVRIDIVVEGINSGKNWSCGLEFDYANEESIYCRPLRKSDSKESQRHDIPAEAYNVRVAYLPPMSGLAEEEPKLGAGRVDVLIGQGQTAQVLRNICFQIYEQEKDKWSLVVEHIKTLFGVDLLPPEHIVARGEIRMSYTDERNNKLPLSSSGRGLQQTLLLLAFLYANPESVLLLDEPDAHLEVLRQHQIYEVLTQVAEKQNSQIIAVSHSEVLLNEAANRDMVIALVGKPHRIDDRGSQVKKALIEIGFDQYYQAEQKGWVIYLEGSTDLAILRAFARTLVHEAYPLLERPFIKYVENKPNVARDHFFGLLEAKKDLVGIALFDRIDTPLQKNPSLLEEKWEKRELENYLCIEEVLLDYAKEGNAVDLFEAAEAGIRVETMKECIEELVSARRVQRKPSPWSDDVKSSDEFLDPLFENYFERLNLPNIMRKTNYHKLAELVQQRLIGKEIMDKLDLIVVVAGKARPEEE